MLQPFFYSTVEKSIVLTCTVNPHLCTDTIYSTYGPAVRQHVSVDICCDAVWTEPPCDQFNEGLKSKDDMISDVFRPRSPLFDFTARRSQVKFPPQAFVCCVCVFYLHGVPPGAAAQSATKHACGNHQLSEIPLGQKPGPTARQVGLTPTSRGPRMQDR